MVQTVLCLCIIVQHLIDGWSNLITISIQTVFRFSTIFFHLQFGVCDIEETQGFNDKQW